MTALTTTTTTEDRALSLLGQGCGPELVASAIGVSVSRISQLLSTPEFAERVAELRFASLAKHNERDQRADRIEDMLLERLENVLPYITDPMKLVAAYTRINAAKRRGSSSPDAITTQTQVVALNIPSVVINQHVKQDITVNINNQVIKAGNQDLVTVQSSNMEKLLARSKIPVIENHGVPKCPVISPLFSCKSSAGNCESSPDRAKQGTSARTFAADSTSAGTTRCSRLEIVPYG